jgi:ribosome-binding factor A
MSISDERAKEELSQLAARYIQSVAFPESLITVTRVDATSDFKIMNIFVTVLPESAEDKAIKFLQRHKKGFKLYVKANSRIHHIPFFDFVIDAGDKVRRRIDEISKDIDVN